MHIKQVFTVVAAAALLSGCATAPNQGPMFRAVGSNSEAATRIAVLESVRFGTMPADTNGTWQQYAGQVAGALLRTK